MSAAVPSLKPGPDLRRERALWQRGGRWVVGLDEVGRGPLAGPVAAGAVALRPFASPAWATFVRDSKRLGPARREELARAILSDTPVGVGWAGPDEIDERGIVEATRMAMARALAGTGVAPDWLLIDALSLPDIAVAQTPIVGGDDRSVTIAAASIVAKVARDAFMSRVCGRYPGYAFCRNKGYPTPSHLAALASRGPVAIHRRSFAPVARLLSEP